MWTRDTNSPKQLGDSSWVIDLSNTDPDKSGTYHRGQIEGFIFSETDPAQRDFLSQKLAVLNAFILGDYQIAKAHIEREYPDRDTTPCEGFVLDPEPVM